MSERVAGYCPMGCGKTLFLGSGGHVTCSLDKCPNPTAVTDLLHDRETEHVVQFTDVGFTIQHPLRDRVQVDGDDLWDCSLHAYIQSLSGPPVRPGKYRARGGDSSWSWEVLS